MSYEKMNFETGKGAPTRNDPAIDEPSCFWHSDRTPSWLLCRDCPLERRYCSDCLVRSELGIVCKEHASRNERSRRLSIIVACAVLLIFGVGGARFYEGKRDARAAAEQAVAADAAARAAKAAEQAAAADAAARAAKAAAAAVTRACVDSTETPEASNGWAPDGYPWITFHLSPRAARAAIVRIAKDASDARQAFGDAGALGVRIYCTVQELATASNKGPEDVQREVTAGKDAYMLRGDMWFYGPSFEKRSASSQRQTVYHEYFHTLQRSLSRMRATRADLEPPLWLIEGSARFFQHAATPRELADFRSTHVRRWEAKPALEEVDATGGAPSVGGNGDAYTVGAVAVDYLATRYGRERIQSDFWIAMADKDWRSAFLHVFGVSVDTFYSEFAAYRQTLRP